jgi:hypothetical protein
MVNCIMNLCKCTKERNLAKVTKAMELKTLTRFSCIEKVTISSFSMSGAKS